MTDHLEVWNCPECGRPSYYWHFETPDGTGLIAELASAPDMSSLESAKAKAVAEDSERGGTA